jgi:hypothetical protein
VTVIAVVVVLFQTQTLKPEPNVAAAVSETVKLVAPEQLMIAPRSPLTTV